MKHPIFVVAVMLSLAAIACSIAGTGPLPTPTTIAPTPTANSSVASVPTLASNTDSQSSNIPTLVMAGGAQNQSLSSGGSPTIGSLTVNPAQLSTGNPPAYEVAVGTTVTIQVDGVQSDSTVTFYMTQGGGAQQALGSAIPNGSVASLVWPVPAQVGQSYVLRAEAMNTQGLTAHSQPITVMPGIADGGQGFVAPTTSAPDCPGAPPAQLVIGGRGQVTPGDPNRLRSAPSTWQGSVVGQMPAGSVFSVIGGPQCSDSLRFWQVTFNGLSAWTADGQGSTYWVQPVP